MGLREFLNSFLTNEGKLFSAENIRHLTLKLSADCIRLFKTSPPIAPVTPVRAIVFSLVSINIILAFTLLLVKRYKSGNKSK